MPKLVVSYALPTSRQTSQTILHEKPLAPTNKPKKMNTIAAAIRQPLANESLVSILRRYSKRGAIHRNDRNADPAHNASRTTKFAR